MLSAQPGPLKYLRAILVEEIGLSEKSAARLIEQHGDHDVQRHAMFCLWMMEQGRVHVPPTWLTASLKGEWSAPCGAVPEVQHSHAGRFAADGLAIPRG